MKLEEVKLTKKQQLTVIVNAAYDFIPLKIVGGYIAITSLFWFNVASHIKDHVGAQESLGLRLFISLMVGGLATLLVFGVGPMLYEDVWKDGIKAKFKKSLKYRTLDMQEKVLKQTDEIILQQKRK